MGKQECVVRFIRGIQVVACIPVSDDLCAHQLACNILQSTSFCATDTVVALLAGSLSNH